MAAAMEIPFVETSALNGQGVEDAFISMTCAIKESVQKRGIAGIGNKNLKGAGGVMLATGERKHAKCCI